MNPIFEEALKKIKSHPKKDEADELIRKAQGGDIDARNELIERNLKLAITTARRYHLTASYEIDDLIAEGVTGMITAIERFEFDQGVQFSTYASWWIWQKIGEYARKHCDTIRVGRASNKLITEEAKQDRARVLSGICSLDADTGEGGSLRDILPDHRQPGEFSKDEQNPVRRILDSLPETDRRIIEARLDGVKFKSIGDELGVTRERIRQREVRTLNVIANRYAGHDAVNTIAQVNR